jgi:putative membrane protein insertion efficiency factor
MLRAALVGLIRVYQVGISSWTPAACRFTPTCSAYAIQALERHGVRRGGWLAVRRLLRCHPWGGQGFDPVPLPAGEGRAAESSASEGNGAPSGMRSGHERHIGNASK